jgi:hypothetical protein
LGIELRTHWTAVCLLHVLGNVADTPQTASDLSPIRAIAMPEKGLASSLFAPIIDDTPSVAFLIPFHPLYFQIELILFIKITA